MQYTDAEFRVRNLSVLAYAQGFTLWHYRHSAGMRADVMAAGFFNPCSDMLTMGDMILVSAKDGGKLLFVTGCGNDMPALVGELGSLSGTDKLVQEALQAARNVTMFYAFSRGNSDSGPFLGVLMRQLDMALAAVPPAVAATKGGVS